MTSQSTTSRGPRPEGLRRRTVLTGAAWSVPVIAIGAPALAAVASQTPTNKVCSVAYYAGDNDYQQVRVSLSASVQTGTIPAGTTLYWVVADDTGNTTAPHLEVGANWEADSASVTPMSEGRWKVAATTATDLAAPAETCDLVLAWMDSSWAKDAAYMVGGSNLTIMNFGVTNPTDGTGYLTQLRFTVAERRTEDLGADGYTEKELTYVTGHVYSSSSNTPTYPPVYWSPDGVTAAGSSYQASDWTNAKYGIRDNADDLTLPIATEPMEGTTFARSK